MPEKSVTQRSWNIETDSIRRITPNEGTNSVSDHPYKPELGLMDCRTQIGRIDIIPCMFRSLADACQGISDSDPSTVKI